MKHIFTFLSLMLITQSVFADMSCDISIDKYFAVYEIDTYTCSSGQYLPANIDGCRACTYGHTCPGGTYTFNENEDQGLVIGSYTCNSGYFLPANSDTCIACPTGYTCAGGTFEFNPNEYQGAVLNNVSTTTMNNVCAANFPIKLFAVYEPNTVTITWDDGTNTIQNTCDYGGDVTIPPTPTRPGYVFSGWRVKEQPVPAVP